MDIILTGVARSGTTLACHLLNKLPGTIALHEPMSLGELAGLGSGSAILDGIARFFSESRRSLHASGTAITKATNGAVPDNPYGEARGATGRRLSNVRLQCVRFEKPLETGFRLIVKHPNAFTALLPLLAKQYPCYAMIRNPLAVLLSWDSANINVSKGRSPMAEAFDPQLAAVLRAEPDGFARQLAILSWYFQRYSQHLADGQIIRYEDLVTSGGRALHVIAPSAAALAEPLASRDCNPLYDRSVVDRLAAGLLASDGAYWQFYSRDAVTRLLDAWLTHRP